MLEDAEIFISVVENKSFSKAARKLKLSAPIVTRHIAKLEKDLTVRLLQRNTRQVSVTEAGAIFYESCKSLLHTYTASLKQVKSLSDELIGTLKIGLPSSISNLYISTCINEFAKKNPDLKIDIVNGNHLIDLLNSGFDIIIHCGELSDSSLYCKKLGKWSKVTCASPEYLKRFGTPKHPDDLRNHNCLDHYDNVDNCWDYLINNKIKEIPITGNIRNNSSMDLKNIAASGIGVVYLPSFIVKNELEKGSLKCVLAQYQVPPLSVYAVYPSNRYLSKKAKVFLDFIDDLNIFSS
jgi:LysR family transcriptional regulator for bpeEF and oprC